MTSKISNNKLQIPNFKFWWNASLYLSICILGVLLFVNPVFAFEDTVQHYDNDYTDVWADMLYGPGTGTVQVVNVPSDYVSSAALKLTFVSGASTFRNFGIRSIDSFDLSYISFVVRDRTTSDHTYDHQHVLYYNESGILLKSVDLTSYVDSYMDGDLYELFISNSFVLLYINGDFKYNYGSISENIGHIEFRVYQDSMQGQYTTWTIDDISTSSIIGMNKEWTQADTNIDISYSIQSMSSFSSSEYFMNTYSLSSGVLINSTFLGSGSSGSAAGFVRLNRDGIFGSNFGLYQSKLMRDSSVLSSQIYSIFDTTVGGVVIITKPEYDQSESESVQVVINSPDFDTYDYTFDFVSSSGSFSQNLVSADTWVNIDFSTVGLGTAYGILSRSGGGSDIEIAFDTVNVVEVAPYLLKFVPSVVYGNSSLNLAWSVGDYVTGYGGESFTLVYNVSGTLSGDPFYSGSHELKGPFDPSNSGSVGPFYINYLINDSINGTINAYIIQEYSNPVYTSFIIPDSIIHTIIHPAGSNYTEPEPPVVPPWDPGDFPSDNETDVVVDDDDLDNLPDIPDYNQSDFNNSALLNGSLNLSGTSTYYSGVSDSVDGFFGTSVGVMSWALSPVVSLTSSVVSFNSVLESSLSSTSASSDSIFSDIGYIFKNLNSKVNGVILFSLCLIVLLVILGR